MPDIGDEFVVWLLAPVWPPIEGALQVGLLGFCVTESSLGGFHRDSVVCQAFVIIVTGHSKWPGCTLRADQRLKY